MSDDLPELCYADVVESALEFTEACDGDSWRRLHADLRGGWATGYHEKVVLERVSDERKFEFDVRWTFPLGAPLPVVHGQSSYPWRDGDPIRASREVRLVRVVTDTWESVT